MAGHSHFKNIMFKKGAQDKKRSKMFTKLARDIQIACKEGGNNPENNSRLRIAIQNAKANSLPKANIERAINNSDKDDNQLEEVRYEGYGPNGVAIMLEALTDNRHRTASRVRSTFSKASGRLGETGCVAYLFEEIALVCYPEQQFSQDEILEAALESGASDSYINNGLHCIVTPPNKIKQILELLEKCLGPSHEVTKFFNPLKRIEVKEDQKILLMNFITKIEDIEEVHQVYSNLKN